MATLNKKIITDETKKMKELLELLKALKETIADLEDAQDAAWAVYYACPVHKTGVKRRLWLDYENGESALDQQVRYLDNLTFQINKCEKKIDVAEMALHADFCRRFPDDDETECGCSKCQAKYDEEWETHKVSQGPWDYEDVSYDDDDWEDETDDDWEARKAHQGPCDYDDEDYWRNDEEYEDDEDGEDHRSRRDSDAEYFAEMGIYNAW